MAKPFHPFSRFSFEKIIHCFTIIALKRHLGMCREQKIISILYPVLLTTNVYDQTKYVIFKRNLKRKTKNLSSSHCFFLEENFSNIQGLGEITIWFFHMCLIFFLIPISWYSAKLFTSTFNLYYEITKLTTVRTHDPWLGV